MKNTIIKKTVCLFLIILFSAVLLSLVSCNKVLSEDNCKKIQYKYYNEPGWVLNSPDAVVMKREFTRLKSKFDYKSFVQIYFGDVNKKGQESLAILESKINMLSYPTESIVSYLPTEEPENDKIYDFITISNINNLDFSNIAEWAERSDVKSVIVFAKGNSIQQTDC